jgi:hypothetical protein
MRVVSLVITSRTLTARKLTVAQTQNDMVTGFS